MQDGPNNSDHANYMTSTTKRITDLNDQELRYGCIHIYIPIMISYFDHTCLTLLGYRWDNHGHDVNMLVGTAGIVTN